MITLLSYLDSGTTCFGSRKTASPGFYAIPARWRMHLSEVNLWYLSLLQICKALLHRITLSVHRIQTATGDNKTQHAPRSPETTAPASLSRQSDLQGKRVVVVEDEGVTQMQLRRALTRAGLLVAGTASNGQDGVETVLRERPDIVLMDIRMPVMDGIEATGRIMAEYPVCLLMLTAFSDEENKVKAQKAGASGYIIKPITGEMLIPILEKAYTAFHSQS